MNLPEELLPQPIEQIQIVEKVLDSTRTLVVKGVLKEGQRITEAYLSGLFGVSRSPVREALKILSYEGFVELLPYRGARVTVLKPENVREHYQLKAMLDGYCCFLAAQRFSSQNYICLKQIMNSMEGYVEESNFEGVTRSNTIFHQYIEENANNSLISQYYNSLSHNLRRYSDLSLGDQDKWIGILNEHQEIYEALCRRDSLGAFDKANRHSLLAMDRVLQKIRQNASLEIENPSEMKRNRPLMQEGTFLEEKPPILNAVKDKRKTLNSNP